MASAAPARAGPLRPSDWIQAGLARLAKQGIQAVRVEVLARDLNATKGSFYWHFRDRAELLEGMLALWESSELAWLGESASHRAAAGRWAQLIARSTDPTRIRMEVAMRAWARGDERVGARVAAIEAKRASLVADILADVGFAPAAADSWSRVLLLVCVGWVDRATRNPQGSPREAGLGELLSEVVLAASARSSSADK